MSGAMFGVMLAAMFVARIVSILKFCDEGVNIQNIRAI